MKNALLLLVVLGIVGLVVGYFIFARWPITNEMIGIQDLLSQPQDIVGSLLSEVSQFAEIRRNILLTGAGGAVLGLVLGIVVSRR